MRVCIPVRVSVRARVPVSVPVSLGVSGRVRVCLCECVRACVCAPLSPGGRAGTRRGGAMPVPVPLVLALALALPLHLSAAQPGPGAAPASAYDKGGPGAGSAPGSQRRSGGVRGIQRLYAGGGRAGYSLQAAGRRFLLDLERDEAPGPRARCSYRGTVDRNPRSLAVFDVCGGLAGYFAVGHARYTVKPLLGVRGTGRQRPYSPGATQVPHLFVRDRFSFQALPARPSCETHDPPPQGQRQGRDVPAPERARGGRRRRSVSRARQVELLLVADDSMAKKYGKGLQHYLLTLATIASRLYGHASIENHIRLAVVKVVVLGEKDKGLEVTKNAATTLKNFCKWQHQHNPLEDDHDEHYDAAILFTREVGPSASPSTSPGR